MKSKNKKILILTGPGGSGKTTIADLLVKEFNFIKIDGDNLDTKFFPDGEQWLLKNSEKLKKAHEDIFDKVKEVFNNNENNIVLDYIIFGNYLEFFKKFKKEFGNSLEIKVLFPDKKEMMRRDSERECWTIGIERISDVYTEFNTIKDSIGRNNFIDTTGQTAINTLKKYFSHYK